MGGQPRTLRRDERLDLSGKLSQPWLANQLDRIAAGAPASAPVVVELDPTSFCDLACPECISGPLLQQGRFTTERLLELCDELVAAGVRAVILIGGGEPLLHPAIGSVIRKLAEGEVMVGLTTNGTLIARHLDAIAEDVAWTRVSVDAATESTYDLLRPSRGGRGRFRDVIHGMERLATCKRGDLGFSFLLITRRDADGTVCATNLPELLPAARLAREVGCDYFEVKPEYDRRHYLLPQPPALLSRLRGDLVEAQQLETETFAVLAPGSLDEILAERPLYEPKAYDRCPVTELRTLLTPTGAFACPYHRGNPDARYGDPVGTPFRELWASDHRQASAIDPSTSCRFHCIRNASNLAILDRPRGSRSSQSREYDPFV